MLCERYCCSYRLSYWKPQCYRHIGLFHPKSPLGLAGASIDDINQTDSFSLSDLGSSQDHTSHPGARSLWSNKPFSASSESLKSSGNLRHPLGPRHLGFQKMYSRVKYISESLCLKCHIAIFYFYPTEAALCHRVGASEKGNFSGWLTLDQGSANFLPKGSDGKYFRFHRSYGLCCYYSTM